MTATAKQWDMLYEKAMAGAEKGRWKQFESQMKSALAVAEELYSMSRESGQSGESLRDSAENLFQTLFELGTYYFNESAFKAARPILEMAWEMHRSHPELIDMRFNEIFILLSEVYDDECLHEKAVQLGEESIRVLSKTFGAWSPALIRALTALAQSYEMMGRFEEAESLYKENLRIAEMNCGSSSDDAEDARFELEEFQAEKEFAVCDCMRATARK